MSLRGHWKLCGRREENIVYKLRLSRFPAIITVVDVTSSAVIGVFVCNACSVSMFAFSF